MLKNNPTIDMFATAGEGVGALKCNVDQMYGIEIEEFPALIAKTALWLTDHQMNMEYSHESGKTYKRLPLTTSAAIVNANALTIDWAEIVAPSELNYILGNPPFIGKKEQSKEQKSLVMALFNGMAGAGNLDFVSAWYVKATNQMKSNPKIQTALVSTNSIIQGEQAPLLWNYLFKHGVHINFLHQTFKWSNDAKGNAAVYCTIIGIALFDTRKKLVFEYPDIKDEPNRISVDNINGYGIDAPNVFIQSRSKPLSQDAPKMNYGSMPIDNNNLILSEEDYQWLVNNEHDSVKYVRQYVGGNEYINNTKRFCLWLKNISPAELRQNKYIMSRIEANMLYRLSSNRTQTVEAAKTPALFGEIRQPITKYLILPKVSSENRHYIPIGFLDPNIIANGSSLIIPDATLYHFGVLQSRMHMAWMRTVAGRLENRYQYSAGLVYNNFIWPEATDEQKVEIEKLAQAVLDARAEFPEASLADLYDPLIMPPVLAKAHHAIDRAVDKLYSKSGFPDDPARVSHLFTLYQQQSNSDRS